MCLFLLLNRYFDIFFSFRKMKGKNIRKKYFILSSTEERKSWNEMRVSKDERILILG